MKDSMAVLGAISPTVLSILAQVLGLAVVLPVCLRVVSLASQPIRRATRRLLQRTRCRGAAIASLGAAAAVVAILIAWARFPLPSVTDEFCYLLAADTFAHGRLTNPTHPMWRHFESPHLIHQPTYNSKYPPGQGLILALGQRAGSHPAVGLWLSTALAAAAACWMFAGWLPWRWALLGGLLLVTHVGLQLVWGGTYWGGNVAMTGGAMVFGALPRIVRTCRLRDSLLLAAGLVILANTRPFEGLVASLPVALVLLAWLGSAKRPPRKIVIPRLVAPVAAVLAVGAACMAYYNAQVTGDPWKMPYQVWAETYHPAIAPDGNPKLTSSAPKHPTLQLADEAYFERSKDFYTPGGFVKAGALRALTVWHFFLGAGLTIPLLALPWAIRSRETQFVVATLVVCFAASAVLVGFHPHYLAPAAPMIFLLVLQSLRRLRLWSFRGRPYGLPLVRGLVAAQVALFVVFSCLYVCAGPRGMGRNRAQLRALLEQAPGQHLVVVRYAPQHNSDEEWVYNAADIDAAKVVWAHELDPAQNRRLLDYFRDRRAWLLLADANPPRAIPYPAE